ncbi:MAG: aspartate ammonia-lyase [Bacteroidetes bacterium]|nr:aspartate ammonia-lyase [Bacteroidota bacterium]
MSHHFKPRIESDSLGEKEVPGGALYGIHSLRARENFPDSIPFHPEWYRAIGLVKQACYRTYRSFREAVVNDGLQHTLNFRLISDDLLVPLIDASTEVSEGAYFEHFICPAISGGAGTSINMNVNEIIANAALKMLGKHPGNYKIIDPVEHANVFQSTNDVIPSSLRVAAMFLLHDLENAINDLRFVVEQLEGNHRNDLRIGYTQMQEAVPTSFGKLFSTYSEALSRDWWRVSKCFERIKVVNLGGSAIGTGIAVPRFFIMEVVQTLQNITRLPVTRSENLPDATSNLDPFVEVHAILKAHAVNIEKMVSDLRLLSSDLVAGHEVKLPARQTGSSIMPGKINPVIPEFVISAAHKIYAHDGLIASLCAQGCLELNAYLPTIGHALLESLKLLIACDKTLKENLFHGMIINPISGKEKLLKSPAIATALVPYVGYHKAETLARLMKEKAFDVLEANKQLKLISEDQLTEILKPENLLKLGFSVKEM